MFDPPRASRHPDGVKGHMKGGDLPPVGSPPRSTELEPPGSSPAGRRLLMADPKEQRRQFRREINRTPKRGEQINGDSCLTMLLFPAVLMFLLVFVLGHIGLAVLLP